MQSLPFARPTLAGLRASSVASNPYFPRMPVDPSLMSPRSPASSTGFSSASQRPRYGSKLAGSPIAEPAMLPTPPSSDIVPPADSTLRRKPTRRPSLSALTTDDFGFPDPSQIQESAPTRIVVRPALSNPVSQLSVLSHSNHTLSPFTRTMEHFTVRSGPPRTPHPVSMPDRVPQKARRKRVYRLGGKKTGPVARPSPPVSEDGSDDMDRYFRYHEDESLGSDRRYH
jgi:distribution and morphology protein 34